MIMLLWFRRRWAEQVAVMRTRRLLVSCESERVWDMDAMAEKWRTDANMEQDFRFDEAGLRTLEDELGMPEEIKLGPRDGSWCKVVTRTEVLLITLERMHRCTTLFDLGNKYALQKSAIGNAINFGLEYMEHEFKVALADVRRWVHYVPGWAEAVDAKTGGVFTPVWGFIDVLIQRICKISNILVVGGQLNPQRYYYCGYKVPSSFPHSLVFLHPRFLSSLVPCFFISSAHCFSVCSFPPLLVSVCSQGYHALMRLFIQVPH